LDMTRVPDDILREVRRYHPVRSYRTLANALITTGIRGATNIENSNVEEARHRLENTDVGIRVGNRRTRNMMDALGLLVNDVFSQNPKRHLDILTLSMRGDTRNRKNLLDVLYYRKMISGIYPYMAELLSSWVLNDELAEGVKEYLMNRFVRKVFYQARRAYAVSINEGHHKKLDPGQDTITEALRASFMESIDAMISFDAIGGSLLVSNTAMTDDLGLKNIDMEAIDHQLGLGYGNFDPSALGFKLSDDIINREKEVSNRLMDSLMIIEGETEEDRRKRADLMSLYATMDDEYYDEDE